MRLLFIDWHDVRGDFRETAWMEGQVDVVPTIATFYGYGLAVDVFWLSAPESGG